MKDREKTNEDAATANQTTTTLGDVETAGETTAADTISGPTVADPVGAETMLKVSDTPDEDGEG